MTQKTLNTVFTKVATQDKAARVLSMMIGVNKQIKNANKQAVQTKVASIVGGVLTKAAAQTKQAGPRGEIASTLLWPLLPYAGTTAVGIGSAAGGLDTPATEEAEKEWDKTPGKNWIPGVGTYRLARRQRRQLVDDKGNAPHAISQGFGPFTSTLASLLAGSAAGGLIGGGIGAGLSGSDGALAGGGAGAGAGAAVGGGAALLANLLGGPLAAAFTKRRTKEQQKAYANSGTLKEYLVPGVASYNAWKSLGRTIGESDERKAKKDKKDEEKA